VSKWWGDQLRADARSYVLPPLSWLSKWWGDQLRADARSYVLLDSFIANYDV